jgi:nicotinate-nucleotide pyrophosphorylase
MLISSIDRWTSSLLADDGIDMPFMGNNESVTAKIIARSGGILAGCAAVEHMLQIWAGGLQISSQ